MSTARPTVLLVGDTLNLGGTEGQFVEVACGLDRDAWDVRVSCFSATGPLRPRLEAAGLIPWSCGRGSLKSPRAALAVLALARYIRAHDVSIVHTFDFYSNVLGVGAGRLARAPVVIASQRDLGNLRAPLAQRVNRAMLRAADRVLANSTAAALLVETQARIPVRRIAVIWSGVDLTCFTPAAARPTPGGRAVVIGTLANLRPEKGLPDLVRAATLVRERCPETRFVIWGEGPLRGELEAQIASLGLGRHVALAGRTTQPAVALRELDVFVLPSRSEACSNALLEAMATGLPVVATRVGGNVEVLARGEVGCLVPPGDAAALARALIDLSEDRSLRATLAARGHERATAEFSRERMLARIGALYRSALAAAA